MEATEDDTFTVKSETPTVPLVPSDFEPPDQIIKVESSDEETSTESEPLTPDEIKDTIFETVLIKKDPLECDIIDLEGDDIDPLAPLRSVINSVGSSSTMNLSGNDLETPSANLLTRGMLQVVHQIDSQEGFLGKIVSITGNADGKGLPVSKPKVLKARKRRRIQYPNAAQQGQQTLNNDSAVTCTSLTAEEVVEHIEMANVDTDLPLQTFVLYKKNATNNTSQLQLEQPFNSHGPSYRVLKRPRSGAVPQQTRAGNAHLSSFGVQNPNFTGIDLNVNINKTKAHNITNSSQSRSQYDVVLGLVLNVNDENNSNANPNMGRTGLNNVALDVSLNMGNKKLLNKGRETGMEKSNIDEYLAFVSKMQSQTMQHSVQVKMILTPDLKSDDVRKEVTYQCSKCFCESSSLSKLQKQECSYPSQTNVSVNSSKNKTVYYCGFCSYQNMNYYMLLKHARECANQEPMVRELHIVQKKIVVTPNPKTGDIHKDLTYQCYKCLVECLSLDNLRKQKCVYPKEAKLPENSATSKTIYQCGFCSYQSTNYHTLKEQAFMCAMKASRLAEIERRNNIETLAEALLSKKLKPILPKKPDQQMYCCAHCFWKTTDSNDLSSHKCSANQSTTSKVTQQFKGHIFCCAVCAYKSDDINLINSHMIRCPVSNKTKSVKRFDVTKSAKPLKKKRPVKIYSCSKCFYTSPHIEQLRSHICQPSGAVRGIKKGQKYLLDSANVSHKLPSKITPKTTENQTTGKDNGCDKCGFNSAFSDFVKKHKCLGVSTISAPENESDNAPANFSCLACSFRTANVALANAHKCQENSIMQKTNIAFYTKHGYCQICGSNYFNSTELFSHVMETHFSIKKLWACAMCNSPAYFESAKDLFRHYTVQHEEPFPVQDKVFYRCTCCNLLLQDRLVKEHFVGHIRQYGSMINSIMFQDNFVDFFKKIQETQTQYPPVGETTINVDTGETEFDRESLSCYSCKQTVSGDGIQCVNSDCEAWYHVSCCNMFSEQLDASEINNHPDWFCVQCKERGDQDESAIEVVENVKFRLEAIDKMLINELNVQSTMIEEMQKIKNEKCAVAHEFRRVKDVIIKTKSEKINNQTVRGVCNIIEKFINAGVDDASS